MEISPKTLSKALIIKMKRNHLSPTERSRQKLAKMDETRDLFKPI